MFLSGTQTKNWFSSASSSYDPSAWTKKKWKKTDKKQNWKRVVSSSDDEEEKKIPDNKNTSCKQTLNIFR